MWHSHVELKLSQYFLVMFIFHEVMLTEDSKHAFAPNLVIEWFTAFCW
ncbi:hypothetical protein VAEU17_4400146 [Vibrio aestuarianus]|nr:hypothetical protein VAEU17_4400146 [Vibrio aestuarianus]